MNPFYKIAVQQANKIIKDPNKARKVMNKALKKSNAIKGEKSLVEELKDNVSLFFSMLGDFFTGKYRKIPLGTGIKMLGALIYFIFIIDLIPDFLAVIGLTDDAAVLAWVMNSIMKDVDKYKLWKAKKQVNDIPPPPQKLIDN